MDFRKVFFSASAFVIFENPPKTAGEALATPFSAAYHDLLLVLHSACFSACFASSNSALTTRA